MKQNYDFGDISVDVNIHYDLLNNGERIRAYVQIDPEKVLVNKSHPEKLSSLEKKIFTVYIGNSPQKTVERNIKKIIYRTVLDFLTKK